MRDVAGNSFVVATGALSAEFHGMITLNETGKFIWKMLENGAGKEEIIDALCAEYEVDDKNIVIADVEAFIEKLEKDNIIE